MTRPAIAARGFSFVEVMMALVILALIISGFFALSQISARGARQSEAVHGAVVNAELAMGAITNDIRSMLPPDPTHHRIPYRISKDGLQLAFYKVFESGSRLVAIPVLYQARPTPAKNYFLLRDGRRIGGVILSRFKVRELKLEDSGDGDPRTEKAPVLLPQSLAMNPRLHILIEGVAEDRPVDQLSENARHRLTQLLAIPQSSPASVVGLPAVARTLAVSAVTVEGTLPELP